MTGQVPNIRHAIPDKAAESDVVISKDKIITRIYWVFRIDRK